MQNNDTTLSRKQIVQIMPFAVACTFGIVFFLIFAHYAESAGSDMHHSGYIHSAQNPSLMETFIELEPIPKQVTSQVPAKLQFSLKAANGKPLQGLRITHERIVHIIVVSEDFQWFRHLHPEDFGPVTSEMLQEAKFTIECTFPKPGRYLIALDYAVENGFISKQFSLDVAGEKKMDIFKPDFSREKRSGDYRVKMTSIPQKIRKGERTVLKFSIEQNNKPVKDLETYLAAPMHLAIIRADLRNFIHAHGEIPDSLSGHHPAGHIHGVPHDAFGPEIEAYVTFPVTGIYQIFSEIKHRGQVVVTSFTVNVE